MKLTFEALTVEHFRSFGPRQEFILNPSAGLWFLRGENLVEPQLGSNGAGKSSIWAALCWVLYGRTAQGLRNPDIKPWVGKGTPRVTLTLTLGKKRCVIERTAKTNGLTINGEAGAQEELDKLIGISFEAFINTLYLAQGLPLFFDRAPRDKLQLFVDVLALDKWEARSTNASKRVKELENLEAQMKGELSVSKEMLQSLVEMDKKVRAASAKWEEEQEEREARDAELIKKAKKDLEEKQKLLDDADMAAETAWIKLREMREDVGDLRKTADAAARQYNDQVANIRSLTNLLDRLNREWDEILQAKNCPTCGQPITKNNVAAHKKQLKQEIDDHTHEIDEGVDEDVKALYESSARDLKNFEEELLKTERETDQLQSKVTVLQPTVEGLKATIRTIQDAAAQADKSNPYSEQIQSFRKEKTRLTTQIEELQEDVLKAQKQLERTRFWVKGFKDVALYLIEEVLAELEAVTNVTLGEVGLVGWEVQYAMERETKSGSVQRGVTVTVLPPEDYVDGKVGPIKWESWSGGEEQRLRLVGAIALSDVLLRHAGIQSNLEIFDEPAKYISGAGVADLCAYLKHRARSQDKTIWLVDHLVKESAVFEGTVVIQKTAKGSIICEQ